MAGNINIKNANGKTLTIQNPDTNNADIVIDGSKIASTVSPVLTGSPTAPTQTAGDNSTKIATTEYVDRKFTRGTAVATTSGTAIDFTGIPSWVKRVTVMFNGVSTNGSSITQIQIGNGTIQTTGYASGHGYGGASYGGYNITTGFGIGSTYSLDVLHAQMIINYVGNNLYSSANYGGFSSSTNTCSGGGSVTLSGVLDRIRITTVNGTDTFYAGSINIMYEG